METTVIELTALEMPERRQYGRAGLANNYDPGYYVAGERLREKSFAGGRTPQVRRLRDGEEYIVQAEAAMTACSASRLTGCNGCPVAETCRKLYDEAASLIGSRSEHPGDLKRIGEQLIRLTQDPEYEPPPFTSRTIEQYRQIRAEIEGGKSAEEVAEARGMKRKTINGILWRIRQYPDVFGAGAD